MALCLVGLIDGCVDIAGGVGLRMWCVFRTVGDFVWAFWGVLCGGVVLGWMCFIC